MLYETLLQSKIFLCLAYFGIISGIFLSAFNIVNKATKNNKFVIITNDIIFCCIASMLFLFAITKFNYGEFRIYELIGFSFGIIIQQISLNKIVEKILHWVYNVFVKVFCKLKKTKMFIKILK